MYVDDLPEEMDRVNMNMFADDMQVAPAMGGTEGHRSLAGNLRIAERWADKWQLVWSIAKTVYMIVGQEEVSLGRLYLYGVPLEEVTEVKYLGLVLSKDCRWNLHWKYVRGKANRIAFAIMKLAGYLKLRLSGAIEMVRAVILAILFHGVPAWAPPE